MDCLLAGWRKPGWEGNIDTGLGYHQIVTIRLNPERESIELRGEDYTNSFTLTISMGW